MAKQKKRDSDGWEEGADTTLAHQRGSMAKAQLKAEGRELPSGKRQLRDGDVETAQAKPDAEKAVGKSAKSSRKKKKGGK